MLSKNCKAEKSKKKVAKRVISLRHLAKANRCRAMDFPGGPVVKTLPSNAGGVGPIPCWGAKIPHVSGSKNQNIKQKQYCNKFDKDFKNGPHQKKNRYRAMSSIQVVQDSKRLTLKIN